MQLVVGLGNPGARYDATRHNIGADFLGCFAQKEGLDWREHKALHAQVAEYWLADRHKIWLAIPSTYMNDSGRCVQALCRYYQVTSNALLVLHDDLDLAPGVVRLKQGGGHGGHNGLRDVFAKTGSQDFYRLRFGIGRPTHDEAVASFVLNRPSGDEQVALNHAQEEAMAVFKTLLAGKTDAVMQHLHTLLHR